MPVKVNLVALAFVLPLCAQVPQMPYSFTANQINAQQTNIPLLSTAAIGVSYLTVDQATGNPFGSNGTLIFMDQEAMRVTSLGNGVVNVQRGVQGTRTAAHKALAKAWIATARYFSIQNPSGRCNPYQIVVRPNVAIMSGSVFDCAAPGSLWADASFAWSTANFPWNRDVLQGQWVRIPVEQGDWNVAAVSWEHATFSWNEIAR